MFLVTTSCQPKITLSRGITNVRRSGPGAAGLGAGTGAVPLGVVIAPGWRWEEDTRGAMNLFFPDLTSTLEMDQGIASQGTVTWSGYETECNR